MVAKNNQNGYTLVELLISILVLGIMAVAVLSLLSGLVFSATFIKKQAVAMTLATNQIEYLKSLPFDNLAVVGGSIYVPSPLPATFNKTMNGVYYRVDTSITYVDDAFDGCGSYPTQTLKETYCRNYPPPTGSPATDLNPKDYKNIEVTIFGKNGAKLAQVNTSVSARVAETSSTTGALFVKVIDNNGNPISDATVHVTDTTTSPAVDMSDSTDVNGTAIFYDLKPDSTNYDYFITASISGYTTLSTIRPSGSLLPNFPNQNILTQLSSFVTLTLKPKGSDSLVIETTDTNGSVLAGAKIYIKGGYKKYSNATDTSYYYDNYTPTDIRPTTDAGGMASLSDLDPGPYIFCGDNAYTNCKVGNTTYYLTAAVPYGGVNPFNPVNVPTYLASSPPATTFPYGGKSYLQKVRLMLTTNSSFPRVTNLAPYEADQSSSNMSAFAFQINGANLPCNSNPASCTTIVRLLQNSSTFTASCTGTSAGLQLNCTVNISSSVIGLTRLQIVSGGNTLTMPVGPLGGINVTP
ncbi:MAG: prepilin-type N-terminal cleavage/methylation domain-containing protein [Candidatus Saccharibacteria bacterium]